MQSRQREALRGQCPNWSGGLLAVIKSVSEVSSRPEVREALLGRHGRLDGHIERLKSLIVIIERPEDLEDFPSRYIAKLVDMCR